LSPFARSIDVIFRTLVLFVAIPLLLASGPEADSGPHPLSPESVEAGSTRAWLVSGKQFALDGGEWITSDGDLSASEDVAGLSTAWTISDRDLSAPEDVAVLSTDPLRVVHCSFGICTAARVPEEALLAVPVRQTRIVDREGAFVEVAAGTRLSTRRTAGQHLAVKLDHPEVQSTGELESSALGSTYERSAAALPLETHVIHGDVSIHDTPGGDVIARFRTGDSGLRIAAEVLTEDRDGFTEVILIHEVVRLRGWVDAEHLVQLRSAAHTSAGMGSDAWGCSHCRIVHVASGTFLFDRPNGQIIARAFRERTPLEFETQLEPDGWYRVEYPSIWGSVSAFLPPSTAFLE
jgi:hypothetical protein